MMLYQSLRGPLAFSVVASRCPREEGGRAPTNEPVKNLMLKKPRRAGIPVMTKPCPHQSNATNGCTRPPCRAFELLSRRLGFADRVDAVRKNPLFPLKIVGLMPSIPRHSPHGVKLSVKLCKILYESVYFIPRFVKCPAISPTFRALVSGEMLHSLVSAFIFSTLDSRPDHERTHPDDGRAEDEDYHSFARVNHGRIIHRRRRMKGRRSRSRIFVRLRDISPWTDHRHCNPQCREDTRKESTHRQAPSSPPPASCICYGSPACPQSRWM